MKNNNITPTKQRKVLSFLVLFYFVSTNLFSQNCNFLAPTVTVNPTYLYQPIEPIYAQTTTAVDQWKWYQSDGTTLIANTTQSFTPNINTDIIGESTFYVSYIAIDPVSQIQCESPKTLVQVSVIEQECQLPSLFSLLSTDFDATLCPGETTVLSAAQNQASATNFEFIWYKDTIATENLLSKVSLGTNSQYTVSYDNAGTYGLLIRDKNKPNLQACWRYESITIQAKSLPTYTMSESTSNCQTSNIPFPTITLSGGTEPYSLTWQVTGTKTDGATISKSYNSEHLLPTPTDVGTYTYSLTSLTDAFCSATISENKLTQITIRPLPLAPIVESISVCQGKQIPLFTATGMGQSIFHWYADIEKSTTIAIGNTFAVTETSIGVNTYYVTQIVDGCEGPITKTTLTIKEKPQNPIVTNAIYNQSDLQIPQMQTDGFDDYWYETNYATQSISQGISFAPTDIPTQNKTYFVQREISGCVSDRIPVSLLFISNAQIQAAADLQTVIDSANALLDGAYEEVLKASNPRKYKTGAIAQFIVAIEKAVAIHDNVIGSVTEYNNAADSLKLAMQVFQSMDITAIENVERNNKVYYNSLQQIIVIDTQLQNIEPYSISISNILGEQIVKTRNSKISTTGLAEGVYFVKITGKNCNETHRLIIKK